MQPNPPGYVPDQPQVVYTQQPGVYPPLDPSADQFAQDAAITVQPGAVAVPAPPGTVIVPIPAPIEGVTPGLEYLTMVDTIFVQQVSK